MKISHRLLIHSIAIPAAVSVVVIFYLSPLPASLATTVTCDLNTHYLKVATNECRSRSECYDAAGFEYNSQECQAVRGTSSGNNTPTTCQTGYTWNGTGCVINTTCPTGYAWSGTACVSNTPTVTQQTQIWNSLGLSSQIRSDADPARIDQLKQHCANVPSGTNVWIPNSGTFSSVDFGMPDPAKCTLAASCTSTQNFNGTACVANQTTCQTGYTWSGTACVSNITNPAPATGCSAALITLLGTACRNMDNAYFNGELTQYVLPGTTVLKDCSTAPITNCSGQSPWSVPVNWKEVTWNNLGLRSYVSVNAPQSVIDAAKAVCANTAPDKAVFSNASDFSKPDTAGIPTCTSITTITYPYRFFGSGYICSSYQECFNYCKTTPGSGTGDPAICDRHFPGATTFQDSAQRTGQISGVIKDEAGVRVNDFYGIIYAGTR